MKKAAVPTLWNASKVSWSRELAAVTVDSDLREKIQEVSKELKTEDLTERLEKFKQRANQAARSLALD